MLRLLAVISALVLGLAFHSRNHQTVTVDLYTRTFEMPLSWVVVAALSLGVLLGALALSPRLVRARRALRREQKRARLLEAAGTPADTAVPVSTMPGVPDGH